MCGQFKWVWVRNDGWLLYYNSPGWESSDRARTTLESASGPQGRRFWGLAEHIWAYDSCAKVGSWRMTAVVLDPQDHLYKKKRTAEVKLDFHINGVPKDPYIKEMFNHSQHDCMTCSVLFLYVQSTLYIQYHIIFSDILTMMQENLITYNAKFHIVKRIFP